MILNAAEELDALAQIDLPFASTLRAARSIEAIFTDRWQLLVIFGPETRFHARVARQRIADDRHRSSISEVLVLVAKDPP